MSGNPAFADLWNYGTKVSLNSDWNDNIALADEVLNPQSTFRFLAAYDGEFERQGAATRISFMPRVTTDYYPDSQFRDLQATDLFLPGGFTYQRPLTTWSLGFNASRQSVLSDEATTSQETPIGTLRGDDTLSQYSINPTVTWQLTEKDNLLFGLNYGISDYDLEFTNRSDTDSVGGNFTYRRSLNERNTIGISGFFSASDSDRRAFIPVEILPPTDPPTFQIFEGKVTTDSTSSFFTADYDYELSKTSLLTISYGIQEATTESKADIAVNGQGFNTGSLSFNSSTYDVGYIKKTELTKYNLKASRIVTLDITNGQPQDRYQLIFEGEHKLTERLLGAWRLQAWQQEAVALQSIDQDDLRVNVSQKLRYASAELELSWNITRKWYLNGRYAYRRRDTDRTVNNESRDLKATSNQVTLGISYAWKEIPRR